MALDEAVYLVDVDVCRPEACPGCDPQEDCVLVTVSSQETNGTPYLYVNDNGGDLDQWDDGIALASWTGAGEDPSAILCLGDLVVIPSNVAGAVYYSDDLGTTLVEVTETDWATNGMNDIDGLDHTFIVMVGDAGHIWVSYDAARNWELSDDGLATTQNLTRVMIARDNPLVIYAAGASNALVKTENGGKNWYALTGPCAGDAITALYVKNQYDVLVGNDDGEIHQTEDGGESWAQQTDLPDLPAAPMLVDIIGCGCDGVYAIVYHTGGTGHRIYRNIDGGADGRWYIPENVPTPPDQRQRRMACCDINTAVSVGGSGDTGSVILIA